MTFVVRWAGLLAGAVFALALAGAVTAGRVLDGAQLGTSVRERACTATPLGGLTLLVLVGALLAGGLHLVRLRDAGAVLLVDPTLATCAAIAPAVLLVLTAPGVAGCRSSAAIADWPVVGPALVGTSGIALAGAAASAFGVALAQLVHVERPGLGGADAVREEPSIVDLAIEEAEALEEDPSARRFRGVDDVD